MTYKILGIQLVQGQKSAVAGATLQLIQSYEKPPPPELHAAPSGKVSFPLCVGTFLAFSAPTAVGCVVFASGCPAVAPGALAAGTCGAEIAGVIGCYAQAHGKPFANFGEDLPPGDVMPEKPTPPLRPEFPEF